MDALKHAYLLIGIIAAAGSAIGTFLAGYMLQSNIFKQLTALWQKTEKHEGEIHGLDTRLTGLEREHKILHRAHKVDLIDTDRGGD